MTNNNIAKLDDKKQITDVVLEKVSLMQVEGSLDLPRDYSAANALKSAFLILQETKTKDRKPVLEACTNASIANALLDMVVQGLNPAKNQVYFIPYGNELQMQRSYLGTVAITKRLPDVKDVKGYAIYEDDELELGFDLFSGKTTIEAYKPSLNKDPSKLVGAMAIVIGHESILHVEYMDMGQIRAAWNQGQTKGASPAHKGFPDQMAIKTVINRACKMYANTSDDSDLIMSYLNQESADEVDAEIIEEKEEEANSQVLTAGGLVDTETGEIIDQAEDVTIESAPF